MSLRNLLRRVRGLVGNALVWGVCWSVLLVAIYGTAKLAGVAPPTASWGRLFRTAARVGVVGTIVGVAFSTFIGIRYRGRSVAEISALRFGLGGGVLAGVFLPLFVSFMRLVTGQAPLGLEPLVSNGLLAAVLGGGAAGFSIKLAQFSERALPRAGHESMIEGGEE